MSVNIQEFQEQCQAGTSSFAVIKDRPFSTAKLGLQFWEILDVLCAILKIRTDVFFEDHVIDHWNDNCDDIPGLRAPNGCPVFFITSLISPGFLEIGGDQKLLAWIQGKRSIYGPSVDGRYAFPLDTYESIWGPSFHQLFNFWWSFTFLGITVAAENSSNCLHGITCVVFLCLLLCLVNQKMMLYVNQKGLLEVI